MTYSRMVSAWLVGLMLLAALALPPAAGAESKKILPVDMQDRPELVDAVELLREAQRQVDLAPPVYEGYPARISKLIDAAIVEVLLAIEANRETQEFYEKEKQQGNR